MNALSRRLRITLLAACALVTAITGPIAYAAIPHEDPGAAVPVYDGVALLRYYSDSLDLVLAANATAVKTRLSIIPFANLPGALAKPAAAFAVSTTNLAALMEAAAADLAILASLTPETNVSSSMEVTARLDLSVAQAYSEFRQADLAARTIGKELTVDSASSGTPLALAYDELTAKLAKIKGVLDQYTNSLSRMKALEKAALDVLAPTTLTFTVSQSEAFVGESISFEGALTTTGQPLPGQPLDVLVGGTKYANAITGADGRYSGTFQVPGRYVPEIDLQAAYSPSGGAATKYLASTSRAVKLKVLYYDAKLSVTLPDTAYPGIDATLSGVFSYGGNPSTQRSVEIRVDKAILTRLDAIDSFSTKLVLPPDITKGNHTITVTAGGLGRYAPVTVTTPLLVARAVPSLDIDLPSVVFIPGSVEVRGRIYSGISPVSRASVKVGLGAASTQTVSSEEGDFAVTLKTIASFGLIGSEGVQVEVTPGEPWHTRLVTAKKVLAVNLVNCGVILLMLAILAYYLPRRFRKTAEHVREPDERTLSPVQDESPAPAFVQSGEGDPLRVKVFQSYQSAVRHIQGLTGPLLRHDQTLREFANETGRIIGPVAKYLLELTRLIERLVYSPYPATEADVRSSSQFVRSIESAAVPLPFAPIPGVAAEKSLPAARAIETSDAGFGVNAWLWLLVMAGVVLYSVLTFMVVEYWLQQL